jgi:hypothetical protein
MSGIRNNETSIVAGAQPQVIDNNIPDNTGGDVHTE